MFKNMIQNTRRGEACPAPTNQITNQKIKNMKKIGLTIGTTAVIGVSAVKATDEYYRRFYSDVPTINIMASGDSKLSVMMGRFQPFGQSGVYAMPTQSNYSYESNLSGEAIVRNFNTPKKIMSLGLGAKFDISRNSSLIAGQDRFSSLEERDFNKTKTYAGLQNRLGIFNTYAGVFREKMGIYGEHMGANGTQYGGKNTVSEGTIRTGIEFGVGLDIPIIKNLDLNLRAGYSQNLSKSHPYSTYSGEATASIGLHYKLPLPNIKIGGPAFEPKPKRTKIKKSKTPQRYQMIPCPPNFKTQKRSWKK